MGLFDRLTFEDGIDVELADLDTDPTEITWQTKSIGRPAMATYKVTADGRLFERQERTAVVPEEERPGYDEDLGGFESEWQRSWGMIRTIPEGWTDRDYHGILEFHATIGGEYVSYEGKFTDGELVDVRSNEHLRGD